MTKFLLVTDLDNTLVGDDSALQSLNEKIEQHRVNFGSLLIYSTGRSLASYQDLRNQTKLLEPDALIVSVGTEIYLDGGDSPESEWSEQLRSNWNRTQILESVTQVADLTLQSDSDQGEFKISFSVNEDTAVVVVPRLEAELQQQGISANVIYSAGQHLDILPQQVDKGAAMQFLRQKWQISAFHTVVCGDSGNDIALFKSGAERGIIVGSAQPELLSWHEQNPVQHHYLAQGHCASGIIEGLYHFRFLP